MCLHPDISDSEWLHADLQRGQDLGAGRSTDGSTEWDVPQYHRRRPDEAHHQIWHDGQSRSLLAALTEKNELNSTVVKQPFWTWWYHLLCLLLRLYNTVWAVSVLLWTRSHTTTSLFGLVLIVTMVRTMHLKHNSNRPWNGKISNRPHIELFTCLFTFKSYICTFMLIISHPSKLALNAQNKMGKTNLFFLSVSLSVRMISQELWQNWRPSTRRTPAAPPS